MTPRSHPDLRLTYSMNVHSGDSFMDQWSAAKYCAVKVRESITPECGNFGLGLRLSNQAVEEALGGNLLSDFSKWCHDEGFHVFTINGFPFGNFHEPPVKSRVYRPDWTGVDRVYYTRKLFDALSRLPNDRTYGSVSTVPLFYRPDYQGLEETNTAIAICVKHLIEMAEYLEALSEKSERDLVLALEPEPWCCLESSGDVVDFYETHLLPAAGGQKEPLIRKRIGVCIDTCHCALAYECPAEVISKLKGKGIRIAKIQISAAPAFSNEPAWLSKMQDFVDPVYLHQTAAMVNGRIHRWQDLNQAISDLSLMNNWHDARVHYHVPLHWPGSGDVATTRNVMNTSFWLTVNGSGCEHLEIETYTFNILPAPLKQESLVNSLVGEYRWVLESLSNSIPPNG